MRISKKILACLLAAIMAFAMMPVTAFADEIWGTGENGSGFMGGPSFGDDEGFGGGSIGGPTAEGEQFEYEYPVNTWAALEWTLKNEPIIPGKTRIYLEDSWGGDVSDDDFDTTNFLDDYDLDGDEDVDEYLSYGRLAYHEVDLTGVVLDLCGVTITSYNHGFVFTGKDFTIKNGSFNCINEEMPPANKYPNNAYGLVIYPAEFDENDNVIEKGSNVVLEDLTVTGGVNVWGSEVTLKDMDVTGTTYYAVWADEDDSVVEIESGTYRSACSEVAAASRCVIAAAVDENDSTKPLGTMVVRGGEFTIAEGKNLVHPSGNRDVRIQGGTYKYENNTVYTVPTKYVYENFAQDPTTGSVIQGAANDGANISVADEISQNFYIDADFYGQESYATLEYNHASNASQEPDVRTDTIQLKDLPALDDAGNAYDGARMLQVIQAPAQSTEPIVINIYNSAEDAATGTNAVKTIEYSVYTYCSTVIEKSTDAGLVELAKATLDYAAAAQSYFNYNTSDMATKDNGGYYGEVASADLSSVTGITSKPAELKSVTVVVKSDLEINLLSKTPLAVNSFSWDATNGGSRFGVSALDEPNGSWYVINVKGIEPANMDSVINVATPSGNIEFTANSIMKLMANSSNAKMATLAKAMYLYGQAADEYFD